MPVSIVADCEMDQAPQITDMGLAPVATESQTYITMWTLMTWLPTPGTFYNRAMKTSVASKSMDRKKIFLSSDVAASQCQNASVSGRAKIAGAELKNLGALARTTATFNIKQSNSFLICTLYLLSETSEVQEVSLCSNILHSLQCTSNTTPIIPASPSHKYLPALLSVK
ncbi:hypothetical protein PGT21_005476 [Puccinia graminis f. sp. tritici]|uniref:Uncharacterized protein n=1 Tax=Puccinia graminis f. sp. tritici TaxID=56615 RepID=A0A5B0LVE9_PUCGR|nr:hypothetical protein PGT21_005589 [Puccinia graminis f. sp. tritici]KAA1080221.1 hypothetical protein PGTUg99_024183 [Puccinia graminis f. sp. tritici]KAA1103948.1 hypothetical protein PGT21_005476 [Puccinia graminis f. sp. tritici]